jgi:hypothetical protein
MKRKKPVLVGLLIFAALIALIVYSTMNTAAYRVEVCMDYNGRSSCRTTRGSTRQFAMHTAISNACSEIASGVTESLACEHTEPSKITWLK